MTLKCKPGDLAVVISAPDSCKHHIGMIIECDYLRYDHTGIPCWQLKKPIKDSKYYGAILLAIADRDLQPIRGGLSVISIKTQTPELSKV